jgi:hypothetical protein
MVRVGEQPIVWHIMKMHSHCRLKDFVLSFGLTPVRIRDRRCPCAWPHKPPNSVGRIQAQGFGHAMSPELFVQT